MASAVIHMAIANEINKKLKRDKNKLLIGSIAPDISKCIGESKLTSHFLYNDDTDIPNIEKFLNKYKTNFDDDFVVGYFIHLYTDYLWFKYFLPELYNKEKSIITKLDGTTVKCTDNMLSMYIYNDYTNLNIKLLDEYNMDLRIFYNEIPRIETAINEIPIEKIDIVINAMSVIIENSKEKKSLTFDIDYIKKFIETSTKLILLKIEEIL